MIRNASQTTMNEHGVVRITYAFSVPCLTLHLTDQRFGETAIEIPAPLHPSVIFNSESLGVLPSVMWITVLRRAVANDYSIGCVALVVVIWVRDLLINCQ